MGNNGGSKLRCELQQTDESGKSLYIRWLHLLHHIFMMGFMDGYVLQCDLSSPKTKRGRPVNEDAVHKNRKNQNQKRK